MYIGLIVLVIGLALLGLTLAKVWRGAEEDMRRWYGVALIGVLLSIAGLFFSLRSLKKPAEAPKIAITAPEPAKPPPIPKLEPAPKPAEKAPAEDDSSLDHLPELARRRKINLRRQLKEDPDGAIYITKDFKYIEKQIKMIMDGYDQVVNETILGNPPPHKKGWAKTEFWNNFSSNHEIWIANLKGRIAQKKGPGTAEVKKRVFLICGALNRMARVYHNSVLWNTDVDYQYISDLQGRIERLQGEIEEIRKERGY